MSYCLWNGSIKLLLLIFRPVNRRRGVKFQLFHNYGSEIINSDSRKSLFYFPHCKILHLYPTQKWRKRRENCTAVLLHFAELSRPLWTPVRRRHGKGHILTKLREAECIGSKSLCIFIDTKIANSCQITQPSSPFCSLLSVVKTRIGIVERTILSKQSGEAYVGSKSLYLFLRFFINLLKHVNSETKRRR